jgi:hypothetical protein
MWRLILELLGDLVGVAALFFLLWVGIWAAHLFS